jgi:hypothetical protein
LYILLDGLVPVLTVRILDELRVLLYKILRLQR